VIYQVETLSSTVTSSFLSLSHGEMKALVYCFQFLLIFRKAAAGELKNDGLMEVYRHIREVDVNAEGVKGAKNFFEAKVNHFTAFSHITLSSLLFCFS